ncbi:hypothetical protein Tco_0543252 [Tanacetum coccineum]
MIILDLFMTTATSGSGYHNSASGSATATLAGSNYHPRQTYSENEHLKSKVVDFITFQTLQVQVTELKSVNESLNSTVEELYKARALAEATLRERDELISAQCEKMRLLEEQSEPFYEVQSEFQIILFEEDKRMFMAKNEFLEKVSSSVQKEYNDLLASNDVLKQRLATKFMFLKNDTSLEKMFEMIDKEYESNVSKISMSSSTFESKNLELVKEMGDKVKCFDEEKKVFETKILKLENVLAQRVKDFDDVKTEL